MNASECVEFLRWALPRLAMRPAGFRKVRRQVCRRIGRRMSMLGLEGVRAYRGYLETHPEEWAVFTYFDETLQRRQLERLLDHMRAGSVLVIGVHERLPPLADSPLEAWSAHHRIYRKRES